MESLNFHQAGRCLNKNWGLPSKEGVAFTSKNRVAFSLGKGAIRRLSISKDGQGPRWINIFVSLETYWVIYKLRGATCLKHISQNVNLPHMGVRITYSWNIFQTTNVAHGCFNMFQLDEYKSLHGKWVLAPKSAHQQARRVPQAMNEGLGLYSDDSWLCLISKNIFRSSLETHHLHL